MDIENNVKQWLSEEDLLHKVNYDENADFHIVAKISNNYMDVVKPKGKDSVVIACATQVANEHVNMMQNADKLTNQDFIMALNFSLNSFLVDFELKVSNDILRQFIITDQIFEDGLTKNELIRTIKKVYKAHLQCIWLINQKFARPDINVTPSNENDMFI